MIRYTVYKHTSPSGKVYVGITCCNPIKRWHAGNGYRTQIRFFRAIQKYGWENIKHELLFTGLTKEEAEAKEIELIAFYHSNDPSFGYNIQNGGNHIGKHSEETKRKMSMSRLGNKNALGSIRSVETKQKLSDSHKGVKHSDAHNKHAGEAHMHPVLCVETGVIYSSLKSAAEKTGINKNCISHVCNGRNKSAGGFHWQFAEVRCAG